MPSAESMAQALLAFAMQSSKCKDNVTVIVARL
jgi:serine/threonine protein phosphatase PrpC